MLGNNIAGIGGDGVQSNDTPAILTPDNQRSLTSGTTMAAGPPLGSLTPDSTSSIVPLDEEGTVVDLPDSSCSNARPLLRFNQAKKWITQDKRGRASP